MSLKMHDLSREQVVSIIKKHGMQPEYTGQNPYIASGPEHEILVSRMQSGLFQLELLDKKQMEESIQQTIQAFKEFAEKKG